MACSSRPAPTSASITRNAPAERGFASCAAGARTTTGCRVKLACRPSASCRSRRSDANAGSGSGTSSKTRAVSPSSQHVLDDCLRITQQAPAAGSMAARFRWLLVRDAGTKAEIAAYNRETAEASWAKYGHLVEERALASAQHLVRNLERVPVQAIPGMIGRPPADAFTQSAYFGSACPAIWSFQLALRALGLTAQPETIRRKVSRSSAERGTSGTSGSGTGTASPGSNGGAGSTRIQPMPVSARTSARTIPFIRRP